MKISDLLKYYNNEKILSQLLTESKDREVAIKFSEGYFGTRPSILMYKKEILDNIRMGAQSFHMSVERWRNPLLLSEANSKNKLDNLRIGWDLILDIDTKILDYAKICAILLCHSLEYHNIKNYSVKFSGGTGFHIAVPFESFPKLINGVEVEKLFPKAAQTIAAYLKDFIKNKLSEKILELNTIEQILKKTDKKINEIIINNEFNPYSILEIDTIAISSRHLIRMPYSINEKKGLISIPLKKEEIEEFNICSALPENIKTIIPFIERDKSINNEAKELFVQAFDYEKKITQNVKKQDNADDFKHYSGKKIEISPTNYPPCIKKILLGLKDGKKRALFLLINYFKGLNYSKDEIKKIIDEWNAKNDEQLRESYIKTQINWNLKSVNYLTPNCENTVYYSDLGICEKDEICEIIKNPLNYHFKSMKRKYSKKNNSIKNK